MDMSNTIIEIRDAVAYAASDLYFWFFGAKSFLVVFGDDFWHTCSLLYLSDNRSKEQVKACRNSYDLVLLGLDRAGQQEVKFS